MAKSPNVNIHLWECNIEDIRLEEKSWTHDEYMVYLGKGVCVMLQGDGMLEKMMSKLNDEYKKLIRLKLDQETKEGGLPHEKDT